MGFKWKDTESLLRGLGGTALAIEVPNVDTEYFLCRLLKDVILTSEGLKDFNLVFINQAYGAKLIRLDKRGKIQLESIEPREWGLGGSDSNRRNEERWGEAAPGPESFSSYLGLIARAGSGSVPSYKRTIFVIQGITDYLKSGQRENLFLHNQFLKVYQENKQTYKKIILIDHNIKISPDYTQIILSVDYEYPNREEIKSQVMNGIKLYYEQELSIVRTEISEITDSDSTDPNSAEKLNELRALESSIKSIIKKDWSLQVNKLSSILNGLSYVGSWKFFLYLIHKHKKVDENLLIEAEGLRTNIFKDLGIEVHSTDSQVCGMDLLKSWLEIRKKAFLGTGKNSLLPQPKGILLAGCPGVGKSLTAKYISKEWGVPCLELNLNSMKHHWVGASEGNLRKALRVAETISPCVLLIDEIEKGLLATNAQGDTSGVSQALSGIFLSWMQEHTKPVFVVASCNNMSLLPSELLRKGRFDQIFTVKTPNWEERISIVEFHLKKYGIENVTRVAGLKKFACSQLDMMTGAEIEHIVKEAVLACDSENRYPNISLRDLELERAKVKTIQSDYINRTATYLEEQDSLGMPVSSDPGSIPIEYRGRSIGVSTFEEEVQDNQILEN